MKKPTDAYLPIVNIPKNAGSTMDDDLLTLELTEIQVLLAEKRTSFALLRTGIAVFSLPMSVLTILIATSKYYDMGDILFLFVILLLICSALLVLGVSLIIRSMGRIFRYDKKIEEIKTHDKILEDLIQE